MPEDQKYQRRSPWQFRDPTKIVLWATCGAGAIGGLAVINQITLGVVEISISGLIVPMLTGAATALALRFFFLRSNRQLNEKIELENSIRQNLEREIKKRTRHLDQEITERKQVQRENERMLNAIEKSSEGFILFDSYDKFIYANQKYKELYPSEIPDLVPGKTFRDIAKRCAYEGIVTSAVGREEEWIEERVAKHQSLAYVSEQKISSGSWVRINEFRTDDGGIFGVRTDITDLKETEKVLQKNKEELERYVVELDASRNNMEQHAAAMVELAENEAALSNQLKYEVDVKDRFFSIISHDLKSPFTSLLGMTQMMSQMADSFSKDKLVEYADNVNDSGNRIFELLQNLLEWSRLQMEGAKLEPEMIFLEDLTRESIEILHAIALEKDISLTNKIKKTTAFADQDMVRTVIRNLIANALKFTPAGGTIEVSSKKQDDTVQITVSDTGVGMSQEQAEKVFSLDQKTSTTGTAGEEGTGLGLPLCKDMLERNQGRIWVESTPGKGSQFHFTLPIEPGEK